MSVSLFIKAENSRSQFSATFASKEEWENSDYKSAFDKARDSTAKWSAFVIPVRVDSAKNFAIDLFLPFTINAAIKVDNIAMRVLAVVICMILDLITLPIRLLTALPWSYFAPKKENNELYQFLKDKQAFDKVLEGNCVKIKLSSVDRRVNHALPKNFKAPLNFVPYTALL